MTDRRPAFYAATGPAGEWWTLLHPPYTAWHLSYVAIGAALAPRLDAQRLVATLLAFFLAVGIAAHALDELHGRPLRTSIPSTVLAAAATAALAGAVVIGAVGVTRTGLVLVPFIVAGAFLVAAYNLELFAGRFHTDAVFAAASGSSAARPDGSTSPSTCRMAPSGPHTKSCYWPPRKPRCAPYRGASRCSPRHSSPPASRTSDPSGPRTTSAKTA